RDASSKVSISLADSECGNRKPMRCLNRAAHTGPWDGARKPSMQRKKRSPYSKVSKISMHSGRESNWPNGSPSCFQLLVTGKFFGAVVILVHSGFDQHAPHCSDHRGLSCQVKDRPLQRGQVLCDHVLVDESGFAFPFAMRLVHLCHGRNQMEVRIL